MNTNTSMHSEMGPLWQNPIQRTVRTAHLSVLMTVLSMQGTTKPLQHLSYDVCLEVSFLCCIVPRFSCLLRHPARNRKWSGSILGHTWWWSLPSEWRMSSILTLYFLWVLEWFLRWIVDRSITGKASCVCGLGCVDGLTCRTFPSAALLYCCGNANFLKVLHSGEASFLPFRSVAS